MSLPRPLPLISARVYGRANAGRRTRRHAKREKFAICIALSPRDASSSNWSARASTLTEALPVAAMRESSWGD